MQAGRHVEELVERDIRARIPRRFPLRYVSRVRDIKPAITDQRADDGVEQALGHRPRRLRRVSAEAIGVALRDEAATVNHQYRVGLCGRFGLGSGNCRVKYCAQAGRVDGGRRFVLGPGRRGPLETAWLDGQRDQHVPPSGGLNLASTGTVSDRGVGVIMAVVDRWPARPSARVEFCGICLFFNVPGGTSPPVPTVVVGRYDGSLPEVRIGGIYCRSLM